MSANSVGNAQDVCAPQIYEFLEKAMVSFRRQVRRSSTSSPAVTRLTVYRRLQVARRGEAADACFCQSNTPAAAFLAGFGRDFFGRGDVRLDAGGKPSTWSPPGELVEQPTQIETLLQRE